MIKDGMIEVYRHKDYYKHHINRIVYECRNKIINVTSSTNDIMSNFDNKHHQIYELFYDKKEVELMEMYHNRARILSANMGRMFDDIAKFVIAEVQGGRSEYIDNPGGHPKKFEIDIINHHKKIAYEIKWRDAGTDGDHKAKEYRKVDLLVEKGYKPIRLTFFLPELARSLNTQRQIIEYYDKYGETYTGNEAFEYLNKLAGINLMKLIKGKK